MRGLGHGFGLRASHAAELLASGAGVPCVEAVTENVLGRGGRPAAVLERVRRDAHVLLHGVSLSIGGTDPLPLGYLDALRVLADDLACAVVSDHLCFGTFGGHHGHDLWPMPCTEEALAHLVARVSEVQDRLGRRIALENPSSYVTWAASTMAEHDFLAELAVRADCLILLDVNNVVVSAHNHGFDPRAYVDALPRERVVQIHVAGHSVRDGHRFDDHGGPVSDEVWDLYARAIHRFGDVTTILEWDENIPTLAELRAEASRARAVADLVLLEREVA